MNDERRQYSRIAFAAPAQLIVGGCRFDLLVIDLSLKGALVRLPEGIALAVGADCILRLELDETGERICMENTVAHVEARQAGLVCRVIDIDSVTHLRRLVELNLGDPELLQRELSALLSD